MAEAIRAYGVELRGAGVDESPFVYRKLQGVLDAHGETLDVVHSLRPVVVVMAGADLHDPYKDWPGFPKFGHRNVEHYRSI